MICLMILLGIFDIGGFIDKKEYHSENHQTNIENYIYFIDHYNKYIKPRFYKYQPEKQTQSIPIPLSKNELYDLHYLREKQKKEEQEKQYYIFLQTTYF